ncbi:hypothetical protein Hanom_Chr05g00448461 [Helianthus anomalus]
MIFSSPSSSRLRSFAKGSMTPRRRRMLDLRPHQLIHHQLHHPPPPPPSSPPPLASPPPPHMMADGLAARVLILEQQVSFLLRRVYELEDEAAHLRSLAFPTPPPSPSTH